jgi:hypothetical protein
MITNQYIKATANNLKDGKIVIRCTNKGMPYGELMFCISNKKGILETAKVRCMTLDKNGLGKTKVIKLSKLARVIEHRIRRKLHQEELFEK